MNNQVCGEARASVMVVRVWDNHMGRCPYCMASTLPTDVICYSCGRVTSGSSGMVQRSRGEFMRGATTGARDGLAPKMRRSQAKMRRRHKGKKKNVVLVIAVACVFMFTPAQEHLMVFWHELQDEIMQKLFRSFEYPIEVEYTLQQQIEISNAPGAAFAATFTQHVSLPPQRTSTNTLGYHFQYESSSGADPMSSTLLQDVRSMTVHLNGQSVDILCDGCESKLEAEALNIDGDLLYWDHGTGTCSFGPCLKWESSLQPGETKVLRIEYDLWGRSFTWWTTGDIPGKVVGKSFAISEETSGGFGDIIERGSGVWHTAYGQYAKWNERTGIGAQKYGTWAIDGTEAANIKSTANTITSTLPADKQDNVFSFAKATFDWMRENLPYDSNAPVDGSRSGPLCIQEGLGDCDEQSNAFMSIMRTKQVPTWYEFGALTGVTYEVWESHAWANIMIPYSDEWCASKKITLDTCFVLGSVDVVNSKWLLHTPTAFTNYIETSSPPTGSNINEYYQSLSGQWDPTAIARTVHWQTTSGPSMPSGTFTVG